MIWASSIEKENFILTNSFVKVVDYFNNLKTIVMIGQSLRPD